MSSTSETVIGVVNVGKRRGAFANFFVRLVREMPLGAIGGVITLIFLVTAIFTGFLAPF